MQEKLRPIRLDLQKENELFLENSILYLVTFQNEDHLAVVNIPVNDCGRFVMIKDTEEIHHITYLDEIIRHEMHHLFSEDEITGIFEIKLSRDAELYIDDIYSGVLAEKIYESLKQRTDGQPTRLLYDASMPKEVQKKIRKLLGLGKIDMMPGEIPQF